MHNRFRCTKCSEITFRVCFYRGKNVCESCYIDFLLGINKNKKYEKIENSERSFEENA